MAIDWTHELVEQLEWHWQGQLRPRLEGLTDDEYLHEPVPGAWSVRPRGTSSAPVQAGSGAFTIDFAFPPPEPAPVTTIAWRLGHVIVGVSGARVGSHFDGPAYGYHGHDHAGSAEEALRQLDATHDAWIAGVRGLDADALARPVGRRRARSRSCRWPRSCCTSTARPSTTAPRSPCCVICMPPVRHPG